MHAPPRITAVVLAAGAARRFGSPKQLAPFEGRPLLEHPLAALEGVPEIGRVLVTVGANAPTVAERVNPHGAEWLPVPDWAEGQSASLRAAVTELGPQSDAIVVLLGDQPRVDRPMISNVCAAWAPNVDAVRTVHDRRPGHPVLLGRSLFPAVAALRGDVGARAVLRHKKIRDVEGSKGAVLDVDVPGDLLHLPRTG